LRLLLALGQSDRHGRREQLLDPANSRRSEELHVLNEIGRALSSTLNKEDLDAQSVGELRRLFDVENFYIARIRSAARRNAFRSGMIDGRAWPKRTAAGWDHLTEYIIARGSLF